MCSILSNKTLLTNELILYSRFFFKLSFLFCLAVVVAAGINNSVDFYVQKEIQEDAANKIKPANILCLTVFLCLEWGQGWVGDCSDQLDMNDRPNMVIDNPVRII